MPAAVDGLKQCSTCRETKPVSEYNKQKSASDGLQYACRSCQKKYYRSERMSKYYQDNKERISKRKKERYEDNKEYFLSQAKEYREVNKERIRKRHKKYYRDNKERILEQAKEYYEANKERIRERKKEYHQKLPAGVYKIENKITGKIYIGQSIQYSHRWTQHKFNMRRKQHDNSCLQHDYDEYGEDSFDFSVIQEYPCDTESDILFEHEQRLIDEYLAEGRELYNTNRGN